MRLLNRILILNRSMAWALAFAAAVGPLSGCRLGANNSEKLSALKSGEIYDEDGVLTVAIETPIEGTLINVASDSSSFESKGTCSPDGAEIQLLIDDSTTGSPVICQQGAWSQVFDSTVLAHGAHSLSASASRNGRTRLSTAVAFTKDTNVPLLSILSPFNNSYINASTDSATFGLSGTCTESGQSVSVNVDGSSASSQVGGSCNGTTWAATINTLSLSAGAHTFQVSIASSSGNAKSSDPVVVTKDITPPTVAIGAPSNNAYVNLGNNSASFAASGTCNDAAASVQLKVDGSNSGSAVACSGTAWNATFSTVALSQGAHTLTALISDPAGNAATSSAITINKDTSAPTISIGAPTNNSYVNLGSNSASFTVSGACSGSTESGRTVTVQVNGTNATQSAISCGAGNTWSGTFSTVALGDATHTLTALLSDVAGNSTTSSAIAVIKDTQIPTVALTSPTAGLIINATTVSATYPIKGTCSENTRTVEVKVDGTTASSLASNTCSGGTFNATIDMTGLSNAAHTITATQTDAAGNTGPSTPPSVSITQDTQSSTSGTFTRTSTAYDPYSTATAASGVARYVVPTQNLADIGSMSEYYGGALRSVGAWYSISGSKITAASQPTGGPLPGWKLAVGGNQTITVAGWTDLALVEIYYRGFDVSGTQVFAQTSVTATPSSTQFSKSITMGNFPTLSYIIIGVGSTTVATYWMENVSVRYAQADTGVLLEEAHTNLLIDSKMDTDSDANGIVNSFVSTGPFSGIAGTWSLNESAQKMTITSSDSDGGTMNTQQNITCAPGDVVSVSVMVKVDAAVKAGLSLDFRTSGDASRTAVYGVTTSSEVSGWTLLKIEKKTAPASTALCKINLSLGNNGNSNLGSAWFKNAIMMKHPYIPSFHDSTQAAEKLTVAPEGKIRASEGAVVIRAFVDGGVAAATSTNSHFLFQMANGVDNVNRLSLQANSGTPAAYVFAGGNAAGTLSTGAASFQLAVGWHTFGMKWSSSGGALWIDGVRVANQDSFNVPAALQSTMTIGSSIGGLNQWNQPIDYAAFYQSVPTDAEMVTYTTTGPTGADHRMDFNGGIFARSSAAQHLETGASVAAGKERYKTIGGSTGVVIEEATTNMLSSAQSTLETDANADGTSDNWTAIYYGGVGAVVNDPWQGTSAQKITSNTGDTNASRRVETTIAVTGGQTYTLSAYVKGGANSQAKINFQSNGASPLSVTTEITPTSAYQRVSVTGTVPADATQIVVRLYNITPMGTSAWVQWDGAQLENKAYATSWQIGGSSRSVEGLTFPAATHINPSEMTVIIRAYVTGPLMAPAASQFFTLFGHQTTSGAKNRITFTRGDSNRLWLNLSDNTPVQTVVEMSPQAALTEGWHSFGFKYNSSEASVWLDGQKVGSASAPARPTVLEPTFNLGTNITNIQNWNQPIDSLSIYNTSINDTLMGAYTTSGAVSPTIRYDFNQSLGQ